MRGMRLGGVDRSTRRMLFRRNQRTAALRPIDAEAECGAPGNG